MDGLAGSVLSGATLFIMGVIEENNAALLLIIFGLLWFLSLIESGSIFWETRAACSWICAGFGGSSFFAKAIPCFSIQCLHGVGFADFDLIMAVSRGFYLESHCFQINITFTINFLGKVCLKTVDGTFVLAAMFLEGLALTSIYADDRIAAICMIAMLPIAFFMFVFLGIVKLVEKLEATTSWWKQRQVEKAS